MERHMNRIFLAAAVAGLTLPAIAHAQSASRDEVIGIPRAVSVVEGAVNGKALDAELDYEKGRLIYEVTALAGSSLKRVLVDATSGAVVSERPMRMEGLWRGWFD